MVGEGGEGGRGGGTNDRGSTLLARRCRMSVIRDSVQANLARAGGKIIHRLLAHEGRSRERAEANFNGQCETRGQTTSGNIVFRTREEDPIPGS